MPPLLIPAPLAASLLLPGCGQAQPAATSAAQPTPALSHMRTVSAPAATTYPGTVTSTRAFVGIVLSGGHARAYVCDGTPRRPATLADWFAGPVRNGLLEAASSQHDARLAARLGRQDAAGTVTLADGQSLRFTIPLVPATNRAVGIFAGTARMRGRTYRAGWIILPDGQQRGAAFFPAHPSKGGRSPSVTTRRVLSKPTHHGAPSRPLLQARPSRNRSLSRAAFHVTP